MQNELIDELPEKGSIWADTDNGYLFQYRRFRKNRLEFKRFDYKTQTADEWGGLYIGFARFKTDMRPAEKLAKHPCCGCPTVFPKVWCDDCDYEAWAAARDAKGKSA